MKTQKVINVLKIRYSNANRNQLEMAEKEFGIQHKTLENRNLNRDKFDSFPTYNEKGKLTLVGKAKRLTTLKRLNLPRTATLEEYFNACKTRLEGSVLKIVKDIEKNF